MPLLDRIEMIADWSAAVRRRPDGGFYASIWDKNSERWGCSYARAIDLDSTARAMRSL